MKYATNVGMLAAVVFAVGMVGLNFSDGTISLQNNAPAPITSGAGMLGHIEVIHTDPEGNILSYQQTDNAVVNDARNCTAMLLFGGGPHAAASDGCRAQSAASLGNYNVIGIGNSTVALGGHTSQLELIDGPGATGEILDNGITRTVGTLGTFTNATGNDASATQRISAQFTWEGANTNTVTMAGLFNSTTTGTNTATFALKNFPTNVAMNTNDQLTVNWDISIGGAEAFGP